MAILKKIAPEPAGQITELTNDWILIGRAPECQLILTETGVSRRHVEIRKQGSEFFVADLRSRNKTKVNNVFLEPEVQHRLKSGDKLTICEVEFIFFLHTPKDTDGGGQFMTIDESAEGATVHTLDASRSSTMASVVRPEAKLKAILDITRSLSSELKIETVAPKILDSLMELFPQAERLFLILQEGESKRLVRKAFKARTPRSRPLFGVTTPADEVPMSISRTIVNHVLGQKKALLSQDAGAEADLPTTASIADLKIRSVMCAPLLTPDGQALGIIQLDTSDRKQFSQDDLDVLTAVCSQAAISIQNAQMHETLIARERLDRDLKLAEQVQKRFLPASVPKLPGYEFFAHYNPTYEVGGDSYDFVQLSNGRTAITLGDVSGKGVAAALLMAKFSGDTRYCMLTEDGPAKAADALNDLLCAAGIEEKFITMSLNLLDPATHELTLASAGHPPLFIRHLDGTVSEVGEDVTGFPLGILPGTTYEQMKVTLKPGDVVVVYSDGCTDPRNPAEELFDSKDNRRLYKRVLESPGGPEAVGKSIIQAIREFSAGHAQTDDITLICFGPVA